MKKKFFWLTAILLAVFLSGCDQKIYTSKKIENPGQETPKPNNPQSQPNPNHTPSTKYKVTITQPENGKIEVTPALPSNGMVENGKELTFTLSANTGYKVKTLTIDGTTYSDVTDNSITQTVKIEKDTEVFAVAEAETGLPAEEITIGNSNINITKDKNNNIVKATGNITLDEIEELAKKSTNDVVINTDALTIKSFKTENNENKILTISKDKLEKIATKLSILKIENLDETKQNITLDKDANIKTISGNISLKDIIASNNESTEITKYIANNLKNNSNKDFDSSNLKINTFYKEKKTRGNISSRNVMETNSNSEYISTPITPTFLKETKLNALNKAILNFKDGEISIPVSFQSTQEDYFDVKEFYKEVINGKLNILKNSNITVKSDKPNSIQILLRDLQEKNLNGSGHTYTPYIDSTDLLTLIKNEKLKDALVIGDMYVKGNVKNLLPLLIGSNKIEEVNNGIKFLNVNEFKCPGPNVTEYDGGNNNTEPLPTDQLLEFRRRTDILKDEVLHKYTRSTRIQNLVLNNIDTTTMIEEDLKLLNFEGNSVTGNIVFKNSNLSKMQYRGTTGPVNVTFDNTILPTDMISSGVNTLILKNVAFPKEEFNNNLEYDFTDLPYNTPHITDSLEIYGEIKDSILKDATPEQLNSLVPQKNMPEKYKGSEEIYNRLKKIFRGEAQNKDFGNYQGSIQKIKDQYLALIQNQGRTRG